MSIFSRISNLVRPNPKLPPSVRSKIASVSNEFLKSLDSIKNTACSKGEKLTCIYMKTESYAQKLEKSAKKGHINKMLKNVTKLSDNSELLFNSVENCFTRTRIDSAKSSLSKIGDAMLQIRLRS